MNDEPNSKRKINWEAIIAEQEKSGLAQKEFCENHGLVLTSFVYYRSRFKRKTRELQGSEPSFRPVKVIKKEESINTSDIRLSLPNGFQCSFPSQLDSTQIKRLVEVLLSC